MIVNRHLLKLKGHDVDGFVITDCTGSYKNYNYSCGKSPTFNVDEFGITGCTGSFQRHNFRCILWRPIRQHGHISTSASSRHVSNESWRRTFPNVILFHSAPKVFIATHHRRPGVMGRILGLDWAPFEVPLERRLQTFFIVLHVLNFTLNPTLGVLLVLYLLTTKLWFVSLGYILWIIYDVYILETPKRGGRRSDIIRYSAQGRYFRDYFPISLVKTADLDPNRNYLMGSHPHGIIGCGALCNFGSEATGFSKLFPGIKPYMLTLEVNFRLPFLRAYVLFMGKSSDSQCLYCISHTFKGVARPELCVCM